MQLLLIACLKEFKSHLNCKKVLFLIPRTNYERPLTTIKGFASTLLADDVTFSAKDQHEFLQLIAEESDRLTELVEQLMDLARLKAGTLRVNVETLPLQAILRMAQARLETLGANHRLIVETPTDMLHLMADGQRVAQVLVNLVGNAAKFAPPGTEIRVRVSCLPAKAQFDVEDQGPGIPPEKRTLVFEAFRQLEPRRGGRRGAGLGLAISKELVEAQGGRIWIQDAEHPGTVISFTLPLAQ